MLQTTALMINECVDARQGKKIKIKFKKCIVFVATWK